MSTKQATEPFPAPGIQHARNDAQRAKLQVLHLDFKAMLPVVDVQQIRCSGLALTLDAIDAMRDVKSELGALSPEYRDHLFFYALQGLRRVATTVQKHLNVQPSDIHFNPWPASSERRPRPPDNATIKEKWRWAITSQLDICRNAHLCLGPASAVLKLCTLEKPTIVHFRGAGRNEDYPLSVVDNPGQAWRDEMRMYAGHALYSLARLLAYRFRGKEVKVLDFSTVFP